MKLINHSIAVLRVVCLCLTFCGQTAKDKSTSKGHGFQNIILVERIVSHYKFGKEVGDLTSRLDSLDPNDLQQVIIAATLRLEYLNPALFYWVSKMDSDSITNQTELMTLYKNEKNACVKYLWEIMFMYFDNVSKTLGHSVCRQISNNSINEQEINGKTIVDIYTKYSDAFGY